MQSGAFEAYDNWKIEVNLRQPVFSFFMEKCTIHENPSWKQQCTLFFYFQNTRLHAKCYVGDCISSVLKNIGISQTF